MRFFDENLVATSRPHRQWWNEVTAVRETFHVQEENLADIAERTGLVANASAVLPRDAWLEFDDITKQVMHGDEGETYMRDLMPLARAIHIGKMVLMHRVVNDGGKVVRSLSGQVPEVMGKSDYDYRGTVVPIFSTGYGRSWREWNTLMSENFDALADDQREHNRVLRGDMADYVLDGDSTIAFEGQVAYGIRTSPYSKSINIGATGANIDLTSASTTSDQIDSFFTNTLGTMLDQNFVTDKINLYISQEIARNWDRSYSGSGGYKGGRLMEYLLTNRRIGKIGVTTKLSGNEFFGFVPRADVIRPVVGMATNTTAMVRLNPVDDYNFLVMGAMGLDIRADWYGRSGVFYSVSV